MPIPDRPDDTAAGGTDDLAATGRGPLLRHPLLVGLLAAQLLLIGVLRHGDIGFDRPGRFGFDFLHFILFLAAYAIALTAGFVSALRSRAWVLATTQLVVPAALLAYDARPVPHYAAAEHQGLVGRSRAEVEEGLSIRGTVTGLMSDGTVETSFVSYDGMTVHYDADDVVVRVEEW